MSSPVSGRRIPVLPRRVLAMMSAFAIAITGMTTIAPPAVAQDADVQKIIAGLTGFADFGRALGTVGKLGEALPLLGVSPGAALGFGDLWHTTVRDPLQSATTFDDLAGSYPLTGDRTGTLTVQTRKVGDVERIDVNLRAEKVADNEPINVSSANPDISFSTSGSVDVTAVIDATLHFAYDTARDWFYVVADGASPKFEVSVNGALDPGVNPTAAFGILGVQLDKAASHFSIGAKITAVADDPDGDGKLALLPPGTGTGNTELAAPGAAAGLFHIGLGTPAGFVDAALSFTAQPLAGASVQGLSGTVGVSWPDIATGAPSVTVSGPDLAQLTRFTTLTPRDLAEGLRHLVNSIDAVQRAQWGEQSAPVGNVNLPFMRGSLADAVAVGHALSEFVNSNVFTELDDPAKAGLPKFTSIQELLTKLNGAVPVPGSNIGVSGVNFKDSTKKLEFTLTMRQDQPAQAQALDKTATLTSGQGPGVSYGTQSLTHDGKTTPWEADAFKGRIVSAGTSQGVVAGNTGNQITLEQSWVGGVPAAESPYRVTSPDPLTGQVSFGNLFDSKGLRDANALNATATVKPSYEATVTLVLDLRDPITGDGCKSLDPDAAATGCPFADTNPDGTTTIVPSLPRTPDRFLLRTGTKIFHADAPVSTGIDVNGSIGYLKTHLSGILAMSTKDGAEHMLTVGLKKVGDADGDIPLAQLFRLLVDDPATPSAEPENLLDVTIAGKATASVGLDVPGITDFFGGPVTVGVDMPDITVPSDVRFTGLEALDKAKAFDFDPDNPRALFGQIIKALQVLNGSLKAVTGKDGVNSALTTPLPVVGKSLSELLSSADTGGGPSVEYGNVTINGTQFGFLRDTARTGGSAFGADLERRSVLVGTQVAVVAKADPANNRLLLLQPWEQVPAPGTAYTFRTPLEDAVDRLTAAPPDYLQGLVAELNAALPADSGVSFGYQIVDGTPSLVLRLDIKRHVNTAQPVRFSFTDDIGTGRTLVGAEGEATVSLSLTGSTKIGFVLPLEQGAGPANASDLSVLPDSTLDITADGGVNGVVKSSVGPLSIALGNPGGEERAVAKAHYNAHLGYGPGGSEPVPVSEFVENVSLALNGDNQPVTCAGDPVADTDLALCAVLPVFVSVDNENWSPLSAPGNAFVLRLPRTVADVGQAFALTPDLPGGVSRFEMPSDLGDKILSALLDFSQLGDGIDKYLGMIERALRLAAFDGKLPLVGADIQQGADEFGQLRARIQEAMTQLPGGGRVGNTGELTEWVNSKLGPAVGDAVTLGFTCDATLQPATAPTAQAQGTTGSTRYVYGIVATAQGEDAPPAIVEVADGAATLNADDFVRLGWTPSEYATGYKIIRKVDPAGEDWVLLADDLGADATTFDDTGAVDEGPYVPATTNPALADCPDSAALADITGATFTFDVCAGTVNPGDTCETEALGLNQPLDIGIPGLSLREAADPEERTGLDVGLSYHLHVKVGVDKSNGFFVATQDVDTPELGVKLGFTLPADMKAQLAFLEVDLRQHEGGATDLFAGTFFVDLHQKGQQPCYAGCTVDTDARIALADLADMEQVASVSLAAKVGIDWDFDVRAGPLPGISGWFHLAWEWTLGQAPGEGTPDISFNQVKLNAGEFLGSVLKPVVEKVAEITTPIQPVIDQLYAPIPVLSDLSRAAGGEDVNLVTIAKQFSTIAGGPDLEFVDKILSTVRLVSQIAADGGAVDIGTFRVLGDAALTTENSPDTAASLIGTQTLTHGDLRDAVDAESGQQLLGDDGAGSAAGFSFPILTEPARLFGLIMGQDVDLVKFDSGPLRLGFAYSQSFGPVYAPPPVLVSVSGSASVEARFRAGFDTFGLRKAIEAENFTPEILDSIYLETVDGDGKPLPVITFRGELAAGAAVSLAVIEVGVKGGIALTINLTWADPNNDGKFRFFEFSRVALANPTCLFNMDGRLSLFLKVYITLGFSIFSVSFDFTLADITLLDFSVEPNCDPPPPVLGRTDGSTLVLNVGDDSGLRGDPAWTPRDRDESWVITQLVGERADGSTGFVGFAVNALGHRQEFRDENLTKVVADAGGDTGQRSFVFQGDGDKSGAATDSQAAAMPFDKAVDVTGGAGDDAVKTGIGPSVVDGGEGADQITTGDLAAAFGGKGTATVNGGGGDDVITVGGAGNAVNGGPGVDRIAAGLGANTIDGGSGDDTIGVGSDSPLAAGNPGKPEYVAQRNVLIGGGGSDRISGGSNDDTVYTGPKQNTGVDEEGPDDKGVGGDATKDAVNSVDTGTGSDTVYGSKGVDYVTGRSRPEQVDDIRGGGNADVLTGGLGKDKVFGGPGDDWVIAEPSEVSDPPSGTGVFGPERVVTHTVLPAGVAPSSKLLVGGYGNDHIVGGDGGAEVFGDRHANPCVPPGTDPASAPPAEPEDADDGRDLITGGAGVEVIAAGGAADRVDARGEADRACGQLGDDVLAGGGENDTVFGGGGADIAYGDAGEDSVYGNDGNDTVYGGAGNDVLEGNDGSDRGFGGNHSDLVVGGTRKAEQRDVGADTLYGDTGSDLLIGDNGIGDGIGGPGGPLDLDATTPDAGDEDKVFGGDADDRGFGGLASDEVSGGLGDDYLEGNTAGDTVHGDAGEDRIIGGSSETASTVDGKRIGRPDAGDTLFGDAGPDLVAGDNAELSVVDPADATPVTLGREFARAYQVALLDLGYAPTAGTSGDDVISGGDDADVLSGQSGADSMAGDGAGDYAEGGPGQDSITGNAGQDDLVGGSSTVESAGVGQPDTGDTVRGNAGQDVALGDNGTLLRTGTPSRLTTERGMIGRGIVLYDLGRSPHADSSGPDVVDGDEDADVLLGQDGTDRMRGNAADDYVEGGSASDWVEGDGGADDLVGGSSTPLTGTGDATAGQPDTADAMFGGPGDDVGIGDNGTLLRPAPGEVPTRATQRLGSAPGLPMTGRIVVLFDLRNAPGENGVRVPPAAESFGADRISGGSGVDVLRGQDGGDFVSGGGQADHLEGNAGADMLRGDLGLGEPSEETSSVALEDPGWPGAASTVAELEGTDPTAGQDDMIGGSSAVGFRDSGDAMQGDGGDDVQLGDNGSLVRTLLGEPGSMTEQVYTQRYPAGAVPADATVSRTHDPGLPGPSTRFCTTQPTCEPVGAFGDDILFGDGGNDGMWGQDGDDTMAGSAGDDDMFGELGDDTMAGNTGADAILGDRGGVVNEYLNADDVADKGFTTTLKSVPQETYVGFRPGTYDRRVDLLHDVDGDVWIGGPTAPAMPRDGITEGGDDRIRGGPDGDNIHAGFGDDLANGDSGGDQVFGGDGADALWGGKGCDPVLNAATADCAGDGAFDPDSRGTDDRFVDHVFGGVGGTSEASQTGALGSDVIDFNPRGSYPGDCAAGPWPETLGEGAVDPCRWFEMTEKVNDDASAPATLADNQHHQGTDWAYGGWDRDVLQGDVAANGPNPGDRLIDSTGAYNLYTHCNAAYGGYNDIRQFSPGMQDFLQKLAWGSGAGRTGDDAATPGTSAFRELALVHPQDVRAHGNGSAYPSTPGHFDAPVSCSD